MTNSLLLFLFVYIVCEFYVRINDSLNLKRKSGKVILETAGILVSAAVISSLWNSWGLFFLIISFATAICFFRILEYVWIKLPEEKESRTLFILKHLVLVFLVIAGAWITAQSGLAPNFDSAEILGFSTVLIFKYILMFLMVTKPVNSIFKKMFPDLKPPEISRKKRGMADQKIGGLIGSMERVLMVIFLLVGQYVAIGFIFTAKSITRYKRISMQREFAEYYLLGTLYSMLAAFIVYAVIFKLL